MALKTFTWERRDFWRGIGTENGKNSFHVKDLNNLKLYEDSKKTTSLPDLSNAPTKSRLTDFPDVNQTEDGNINNPIKTPIYKLPS